MTPAQKDRMDTFNAAIKRENVRGFYALRTHGRWRVTLTTPAVAGTGFADDFTEACALALANLIAALKHHPKESPQ